MTNQKLRNIAIVAHVDHGKTTLVDAMLKQCGVFRQNQEVKDRVMDNDDLEKERGITIMAKNAAVQYKDVKINIVDTPGHADFGGEVERILKMIDGVILLVDAYEGPMPQTRFVLQKALDLNLPVIIAINKIDRPNARIQEVEMEILNLLIDLGAEEKALDYPIVYMSGREGKSSLDSNKLEDSLIPLFETIIKNFPAPTSKPKGPIQLLISNILYDDYVGRIGIGKLTSGTLALNQNIQVCDYHNKETNFSAKISNLYVFKNLEMVPTKKVESGDIVCVSGIENILIGNTICSPEKIDPVPFVKISAPTLQMEFSVNNGPLAGKEGKFVTSRKLRERLFKETLKDVSLKVAEGQTKDTFVVSGRGEIHLSILIENMRREGYELMVSKPEVLYKYKDDKKYEPIERVVIDVPSNYVGSVMEKLGQRRGDFIDMQNAGSRMKLTFLVPTRCLIGYKTELLNDTRGEGLMSTVFENYQPYKGDIALRNFGTLVAVEAGEATSYGLYHSQDRGLLFLSPCSPTYEGMIVGQRPKLGDLTINVCKKKQMSNMRAAGSDEALRLNAIRTFSLEEAIEFIDDDEYIEITPKSIRLRKKILNTQIREKSKRK